MIGRTTFMIAHRLSTVRHADLISTLDRGAIVEQGTHDELMRRGGLYAQMHEVQTRRRERRPSAQPFGRERGRAGVSARRSSCSAMTRYPVAGIVWLTMQYLIGFRRLGYDCYYVESARRDAADVHRGRRRRRGRRGGVPRRADARFDLSRSLGLSRVIRRPLLRVVGARAAAALLVRDADPQPARGHSAAAGASSPPAGSSTSAPIPCCASSAAQGSPERSSFLEQHAAFFTWGENYGQPDCRMPVSTRFRFQPTRQPVVVDSVEWRHRRRRRSRFTTIAGWQQLWREVTFEGELYHWSKHFEFLKFLDLPSRSAARRFELALAGCDDSRPAIARAARLAGPRRRRTSRPTSIPIAPTSAARAASSPSRRTRTCGCAAAGSATAAPPTSPQAGPWSRRTPASAAICRPAAACSRFERSTRRRRPSTPSRPITNVTARPRATSRPSISITQSFFPNYSACVECRDGLDAATTPFQQRHNDVPSSGRDRAAVARASAGIQRRRNTVNKNKLRAITGVTLDTLSEPQEPAFAAADAVARALRDVGHDAIGVIGKQADARRGLAAPERSRGSRAASAREEEPGEAWVADETALGNHRPRLHRARLAQWKRIERPQADAATRWAADRRGAECHSCQCPAGDAAWAAPCVHRRFRCRAASP